MRIVHTSRRITASVFAAALLAAASAHAEILPVQVAIVANSRSKDSVEVAEHYSRARGVPKSNLVSLPLPTEETMSREAYERELLVPLRQELERRQLASKVRVVLTVHGVPLRIASPEPANDEKQILLDALAKQRLAVAALGELLGAASVLAGGEKRSLDAEELQKSTGQALVQRVEAEVRAAGLRIAKLPPEKQAEEGRKFSEIVIRFGGFTALVNNLKPKEESVATEAQQSLAKMRRDIESAEQMLSALAQTPSPENRQRQYGIIERLYGATGVLGRSSAEIQEHRYEDADAAVDSELTLLWLDRDMYSLSGRLPNPYFYQNLAAQAQFPWKLPVLMVSRIDGPTAAAAKAMVERTLQAETSGLRGTAYIDARGASFDRKNEISVWDQNLRDLAWMLRRTTKLDVEADNSEQLLEEGEDAALYVGWYSLRNYRDVFTFVPGAIAYHIASEEAVSIRGKDEKGWCKNLLERGVSATVGAIAEPYLDSFPLPRELFGLMLTGKYSLVEAYFLTARYVSWRMVLFGDPLYNPWRDKGTIPLEEIALVKADRSPLTELPPSPGKFPFEDPVQIRAQLDLTKRDRKAKLDQFFRSLESQRTPGR